MQARIGWNAQTEDMPVTNNTETGDSGIVCDTDNVL